MAQLGPNLAQLGSILAPPGPPKTIENLLFFIGFCYFSFLRLKTSKMASRWLEDGPKSRPRAPKRAPGDSKRAPKGSKMAPRGPQEDPKTAPRRPQDGPQPLPSRSRKARYVNLFSRSPKMPPRTPWAAPPGAPRGLQEAPEGPQEAPKRPQDAPKRPKTRPSSTSEWPFPVRGVLFWKLLKSRAICRR